MEELQETIKIIDDALRGYIYPKDNPQSAIYDAMSYSLFAGGKRLRPVLMLKTCEMCGGSTEKVIPFACAMEMIHTYSLIHDDLPAMDNDDLRRGIPTCHKKFGEAVAILAGDALLNKAFEVVSSDVRLPAETALKCISILASSSGCDGMIGGQIVDLQSENKTISPDELRYLHSLKTGAIIRSACVIGATAAEAAESEIRAVADFADALGIAFQIQDDILDVLGDTDVLGKPVGSDAENCKNTYVSLFGIDKADKLQREYADKAVAALDIFGEKSAFLKKLAISLTRRNS